MNIKSINTHWLREKCSAVGIAIKNEFGIGRFNQLPGFTQSWEWTWWGAPMSEAVRHRSPDLYGNLDEPYSKNE